MDSQSSVATDNLDFRLLFESAPAPFLVLSPDLNIVAATDAYLRATMTVRSDIIGRHIFEAFPDNPNDPEATGVRNLRASLQRVVQHRQTDTMAVQKYDVRITRTEDAAFEERYWSPMNVPVCRSNGDLAYIIHYVEDVTEFVRLRQYGIKQDERVDELSSRGMQLESEMFLRAQQLAEMNRQLIAANEELSRLRADLEARVEERTAQLKVANLALRAEVNEHEQTEELLRRQREKLEVTMSCMGDGVIVTDAEGRVELLNVVAEFLTGFTAAGAKGKHLDEIFRIINTQTGEPVQNPVHRVLREGVIIGLANHTTLISRDGTPRPIDDSAAPIRDDNGNVMGVVLIFRDVTERYQAEEQLRASEARFRLLVDSIRDYAIFMTDQTGKIVTWNAGAERLYGYTTNEAIGLHLSRFYSPEDQAKSAPARRLKHAATSGGYQFEGWRVRKDGTRFWAEVVTTSMRDSSGHLTGFVVIARDMTDHRTLEEQFRQSQKLEAVGSLAGGVAHDFNNLLTVINGYADVLLYMPPNRNELAESLRAIRDAGHRAAALTSQLLAFSRKTIVEPKILNLNEVIEQLSRILTRLLGEDIVLTTTLAPALDPVKADPTQIEQIVLNLAVNARDAMPTGGRLTIETRNIYLRSGEASVYPDLRPGRYVQLALSDNGCGMTEDVKARVFEPFFTTKELGKGTGLGLSMVYGAVKSHGGHVSVYSELQVGTTFKILIPSTSEHLPPPRSSEIRLSPRGAETILLAEDDESVRKFTRLALESQGYQVLEGGGGAEALQVGVNHHGKLHLLVTDVVMPGMGGRELAESLRKHHPEMKILYVSGYTDDAIVRHGIVQATDAFLQKPFTPLTLARKIRAILDGVD